MDFAFGSSNTCFGRFVVGSNRFFFRIATLQGVNFGCYSFVWIIVSHNLKPFLLDRPGRH